MISTESCNSCRKLTLSQKISAPWSWAQLAMAWDTLPMPPSTYPHAPFTPSSSPITWCSSTYLSATVTCYLSAIVTPYLAATVTHYLSLVSNSDTLPVTCQQQWHITCHLSVTVAHYLLVTLATHSHQQQQLTDHNATCALPGIKLKDWSWLQSHNL